MRLLGAIAAASLTLSALAVAAPAEASPSKAAKAPKGSKKAGPSDDRKTGQREFAEGQRAFAKRDYRHAAESFESAYKHAPHPDALWNAARSWARAGEKARAANLYAKYLDQAPAKARDRNSATDALRDLSSQLAKLEIHATDVEDVTVDGDAVEGSSVYVTPGTHVIQGHHGGEDVQKSQEAAAGAVVSVALVPPPPPPKPSEPPPEHRSHGISPGWVIAGVALTAGAGATLAWSGIDTLNEKKSFTAMPTQEKLEAGRTKQLRTNVMIGVTAGLGAITLGLAAFAVDWHRWDKAKKEDKDDDKEVSVSVGPGSLLLRGKF